MRYTFQVRNHELVPGRAGPRTLQRTCDFLAEKYTATISGVSCAIRFGSEITSWFRLGPDPDHFNELGISDLKRIPQLTPESVAVNVSGQKSQVGSGSHRTRATSELNSIPQLTTELVAVYVSGQKSRVGSGSCRSAQCREGRKCTVHVRP